MCLLHNYLVTFLKNETELLFVIMAKDYDHACKISATLAHKLASVVGCIEMVG